MIGCVTPGEWEWRAALAASEAASWRERTALDDLVDAAVSLAEAFAQIGLALAEVFADGTMADKQEA